MIGVERWAPATNLPDDSRSTRRMRPIFDAQPLAQPLPEPIQPLGTSGRRYGGGWSLAGARRIVPPMQTHP